MNSLPISYLDADIVEAVRRWTGLSVRTSVADAVRFLYELIDAGETHAEVRFLLLELSRSLLIELRKSGRRGDAIEAAERGIGLGESFLEAGETAVEVRELILRLFGNLAVDLAELDRRGDAIEAAKKGSALGESFLEAGETALEVRRLTLRLFVNLEGYLGESGRRDDAIEAARRGIALGESFLEAGETAVEVRGTTLHLLSNLGFNLRESGLRDDAIEAAERGIALGESFLAAGETAIEVRGPALRLFSNLVVYLGDSVRRDDAIETANRGIALGESFLEAGETAAEVRGLILELFLSEEFDLRDSVGKDDAIEMVKRGIALGESFLAAGETATEVRGRILRLFSNLVVYLGDSGLRDDAIETAERGIALGESFLAAGETATEVRGPALQLFLNLGFNLRESGLRDDAIEAAERGIALGESFLAAGETATEVRGPALRLFSNLVVYLGDSVRRDDAIETANRGIALGESFLEAGETEAEVRGPTLNLFRSLAFDLWESGRRDDAIEAAEWGIALGESFLEAGETAAEVRGPTLDLFVNLGGYLGELDRRDDAIEVAERGIALGESFLEAGETAAKVRVAILDLFKNLGIDLWDSGRRDDAIEAAERGIALGESFLEAGETAAKVRGAILGLFNNLGTDLSDSGRRDDAIETTQRGIVLGESFLEAGETAAEVRGQTLHSYNRLREFLRDSGRRDDAIETARRGIALGESFLEAGETAAEVRGPTLELFFNLTVNLWDSDRRDDAIETTQRGIALAESFLEAKELLPRIRYCLIRMSRNCLAGAYDLRNLEQARRALFVLGHLCVRGLSLGWLLEPAGISDIKALKEVWAVIIQDSNPEQLALHWHGEWRDRLAEGRDQFLVDSVSLEAKSRRFRMVLCTLVIERAERMRAGVRAQNALDHAVSGLDKALAELDSTRARRRLALVRGWEWLIGGLPPTQWREAAEERLRTRLAQAGWLKRMVSPWRWWSTYRSLSQSRPEDPRKLAECPDLERSVRAATRALAAWWSGEVVRLASGSYPCRSPGEVVLGKLVASLDAITGNTFEAWLSNPPWANDEDLKEALKPTGWRNWLHEKHENSELALYVWTSAEPGGDGLEIDGEMERGNGQEVAELLAELDQGDGERLRQHLAGAWGAALDLYRRLEAGLALLGTQQDRAEAEWVAVFGTGRRGGQQDRPLSQPELLARILCGKAQTGLTEAMVEYLTQDQPSNMELDSARAELKRQWEQVCRELPTPTFDGRLVGRLQAHLPGLLSALLEDPELDTKRLWQVFEDHRIALNGLHIEPPEAKWWQETGEGLKTAMSNELDQNLGPDHWPALSHWLTRVENDIVYPQRHDEVAACCDRLEAGEALVQLFFHPDTGHLCMLWLGHDDDRPDLKFFPETCHLSAWKAADDKSGLLDRWREWLEFNPATDDFFLKRTARLWEDVREHPALVALANTLAAEAKHRRADHLVLLLPANLSQLPLETLAGERWPEGFVSRAATLNRWRRPSEALQGDDEPQVCFDASETEPLIHAQARVVASVLKARPRPAGQGLTPFDLPQALQTQARVHLVFHGQYQPGAPHHSYLKFGADDRALLWTLCARPLAGARIGLAACESALSGRSADPVLAPVGIAPALLAAGAEEVVGALWRVHKLTAWVFFEHFYRISGQNPKLPLAERVARATEALALTSGTDLAERVGPHFSPAQYREIHRDHQPLFKADQPFNHPTHTAAFVGFGD